MLSLKVCRTSYFSKGILHPLETTSSPAVFDLDVMGLLGAAQAPPRGLRPHGQRSSGKTPILCGGPDHAAAKGHVSNLEVMDMKRRFVQELIFSSPTRFMMSISFESFTKRWLNSKCHHRRYLPCSNRSAWLDISKTCGGGFHSGFTH